MNAPPGVSKRRRLLRFVALTLSLMISLTAAELYARWFFSQNWFPYELPRQLLTREPGNTPLLQNCVSQPYQLYAPAPSLDRGYGQVKHSPQGFRGDPVPLERAPNVARILCLGGSTTYGTYAFAEKADYPARMQQMLAQEDALPEGVKGLEVINGGLPWATTAELLTHYLFKYRYFKPDMVVINTGANDALALREDCYYQPDYSHMRQPLKIPAPLSSWGRKVCQSRLIAWGVIRLLYDGDPRKSTIQLEIDKPPQIKWHPAAKDPQVAMTLSDEELAFTHNLHALVTQIRADGAKLLFMPVRMRPGSIDEGEARNEQILKDVATELDVPYASFPTQVISPQNWTDNCHVNENGCLEKAAYVAPIVRSIMWPNAPSWNSASDAADREPSLTTASTTTVVGQR